MARRYNHYILNARDAAKAGSPPPGGWVAGFSDTLRKIYGAIKRPLAIAMVVIVVLADLVPVPVAQTTALGVLAIIMVEILFDIHKQLTEANIPRIFPDFISAAVAMRDAILEALSRKQSVRIRALGMSMGHAWPFLSSVLLPVLQSQEQKVVHLEVAMLDGHWDELARLNPYWAVRANAHHDEIVRFVESNREKLLNKGWRVDIYRYRHVPNWHGILLDDDKLFLSTCSWKDDILMGAENQYEFLLSSDRELGLYRIGQFISWFERIKATQPD